MKKLIAVIGLAVLAQVASAQNARPTTAQALKAVRLSLDETLRDATSARATCTDVNRSKDDEGNYHVLCKVNAKNGMGGYSGWKLWLFAISQEGKEWIAGGAEFPMPEIEDAVREQYAITGPVKNKIDFK